MNKSHCVGCRDNFYNGNNDLGVKECWSFKKAKLVKRIRIGNWEMPPYKKKPISVPDCKHSESQGDHFINPEVLDSKGFWR